MFTLNGIVYASEKPENIQILSAKPLDDMMMLLTFSNGEQRLFDATILKGPAFTPLSDEKVFKAVSYTHLLLSELMVSYSPDHFLRNNLKC